MGFISRFLILFLIFITLPVRPVWAEMVCPHEQAQVDVKIRYVPSDEDKSVSARVITAGLREKLNSLSMLKRDIFDGVTLQNIVTTFKFISTIRSDQTHNSVCMSIRKLTYTFVYVPQVYIASESAKLPCRYKVVAMHEQRHVDTTGQVIVMYVPQVKKALEDYLNGLPPSEPVPPDDVPIRQDILKKGIIDAVSPVLKRFQEENRQRNAVYDTPENYAREQALCPPGEIPYVEQP